MTSNTAPMLSYLFGFPSTIMLIPLPTKNPPKIKLATTEEGVANVGIAVPSRIIIPPVSLTFQVFECCDK